MTCPSCARGGLGQPRVSRLAEPLQLRGGERGGHGDVVAGQQLPRLGMRVGAARRAGGQAVPELRPQRGQHQHRGPGRVPQQLPQPGGDPLAQPAVRDVEVELGLVQPHHGPRPDGRQLAQRGIRAGRVDRMPQPPLLGPVPQQLQRLPAGPGLARRGPAHQHRDPAAALRRRPHHRAQLRIVFRAARTPAAPAARAAGPRAAPAGAPPGRTGQSPHLAAARPTEPPHRRGPRQATGQRTERGRPC